MIFMFIHLYIIGKLTLNNLAYLSIHIHVSVAAVLLGIIQDRISYNDFKMRKLADLRKSISEKMKIEAEESKIKAKYIEEADKIKNQFLEIMSHELRTPLNSIIGFTEILLQSEENRDNQSGGTVSQGWARRFWRYPEA